jgi:hypothetical protein
MRAARRGGPKADKAVQFPSVADGVKGGIRRRRGRIVAPRWALAASAAVRRRSPRRAGSIETLIDLFSDVIRLGCAASHDHVDPVHDR